MKVEMKLDFELQFTQAFLQELRAQMENCSSTELNCQIELNTSSHNWSMEKDGGGIVARVFKGKEFLRAFDMVVFEAEDSLVKEASAWGSFIAHDGNAWDGALYLLYNTRADGPKKAGIWFAKVASHYLLTHEAFEWEPPTEADQKEFEIPPASEAWLKLLEEGNKSSDFRRDPNHAF